VRALTDPPAGPRKRILVVDDEPTNRRLIAAILSSEPYQVVHAASGEQALETIAAGGIDLVLLDVLMPGLDGIETCRHIRQTLAQPLLPVIMVSALADGDSRTRGKEAGADDFLTKPVAEDELLARIRNLLLLREYYALSEKERARAEAEARRWKLISDVAAAVATCRDYEAVQDSLRELLRHELSVAGSCLLEVDGDELLLASAQLGSDSALLWPQGKPVAWDGATWGARLARGRALPIGAGEPQSAPFAELLAAAGHAAAAVVPVYSGGTLQVIFLLASNAPYGAGELALLDDLSPHLANGIANVRAALKTRELDLARDRMSMLLVHDLKNPLSVIKMNLESLVDPQLEPWERDEALRDARSAADQLLGMVLDLLDIGRAEEGRLPIEPRETGLESFTREVLLPYRATAKAQGVTLTHEVPRELRASLDPKLMRRVVQNLLNNAFRYVQPRGRIDVSVRTEGAWAVIRIGNDGPPIKPEVRKHLFDKYGVVHEGQTSQNRGLGLYLCRLVVDGHGGDIGVGDRDGGGVQFEIRLPMKGAK
jgi:signal transduction histidine kinase/DNA-binding response OmpR family regulator